MFRKSRLCKIISIAILVVFTHQQVGWVQEGRPVWMAETAPHYISSKTDPARIDIPYGTGEVREIFSEDGKQRIIHIQDAHASYSAQLSIANILDHLVANYSIDIIALEGAEGYVDTSLLKTFPDKKTRENTAKFLMKEGKLSAGEFFAITRDDAKPALYGVEDDALYKKNVESFKAVMDERALYVGQLEKLLRQFESLSEKVYSRELRSLEYYSELQRKGEISFSSYWEKIERLAEENRIFPDDYANIKKLLWAIKLEKGIDFPKANEERKKLIDVLSEAISEEDLQEMVLRSVSFKEEKISQVDFHEYLTRLAESYRIDLAGYKNLVMFTGYVSIYHQIDIVALYREVNGLEESLRERLYRNSDERQLSEWIKLANLLAGLYSIELENEGFEYIEKNKKELDPAKCSSFIKDACRRYDVPISGGYDLGDVFRNVDKAMEFYRVAEDRNRAMLSNTVKRMKREGKNIAALITGGYHTKGLTDLMREDKLSYMVIVPKFEAGEERPYVAILTNKKRAYQKLLETGKFQIAVRAYFEDLDEEKLMETVIFALSSVVYDGKDWQEEARMWHSLYATEYERLRKEGHEKVQRSIKPEVFARTLGIGKFEGKGQIKIMPCKEGIFVVRTKDGNETLFLLEPGKGGVLTSPRALSPSQASNIKEELEGGPSGERKRRAP
ncbi:MAG: hypothetical protein PVH45_05480, partial [Candidatus Omnitrophota bacterium]